MVARVVLLHQAPDTEQPRRLQVRGPVSSCLWILRLACQAEVLVNDGRGLCSLSVLACIEGPNS